MTYYQLSIFLDEPSVDYKESSSITINNISVKACLKKAFGIMRPETKIDRVYLSLMAEAGDGRISYQNSWDFDAIEFEKYIKENFNG